jgi:hypothetical protein
MNNIRYLSRVAALAWLVALGVVLVHDAVSSPALAAGRLGAWQQTGSRGGNGVLVALADGTARCSLPHASFGSTSWRPASGPTGSALPDISLTGAIGLGSGQPGDRPVVGDWVGRW